MNHVTTDLICHWHEWPMWKDTHTVDFLSKVHNADLWVDSRTCSWPFLLSSPLMMQKTPPLNFWWIFCSLHPSKLNSNSCNKDLQHSLGAQILEAPVQPQPWEAKAGTTSADLHARLHYTTLSPGLQACTCHCRKPCLDEYPDQYSRVCGDQRTADPDRM